MSSSLISTNDGLFCINTFRKTLKYICKCYIKLTLKRIVKRISLSLKNTIPNAVFPNPIEMLNDKQTHLTNYLKTVYLMKQKIGNNPELLKIYFNNEYSTYVMTVFKLNKEEMIKNLSK